MTEKANLPPLSTEGFLCHRQDWTPAVAEALATKEGIELTPDHWAILAALRSFYDQFERHPAVRILLKQLAANWPSEKANSLYLHQLFPDGPIKQGSKLAGLPKPLKCL